MKENEAQELRDEELQQVSGGINWAKFGQLVLGKIDPAEFPELVAAIAKHDWVRVAIIAIPLVAQGHPEIVNAFKQA